MYYCFYYFFALDFRTRTILILIIVIFNAVAIVGLGLGLMHSDRDQCKFFIIPNHTCRLTYPNYINFQQ